MLRTRRAAGGHDARDDEPAPRGTPYRADGRAVCRRHLRRDWRSDPSQADAGALQPGAGAAAAGRLVAGRLRAAAVGRRRLPQKVLEAAKEYGRRQRSGPSVAQRFAEAIRYVQARVRGSGGYQELKRICEELDATRGTRGNRLYYLATAPNAYSTIIKQARRGRAGRRRAAQNGSPAAGPASWSRSRSGTTSPQPAQLNDEGGPGLPGGAGLPHRPLPRERDRPEHPGVPLRQQHLGVDLESPAHRPRPDHGGRVDRRRGARAVLRGVRRPARHGGEPHAPGALAGGDGAAGRPGRRRGPRREGEGAAGDPPAEHGRGGPADGARPVRPRRDRRHRRCRATARRSASRRTRTPRRSWRSSCWSTTGAGPACRSTCGTASACPKRSTEIAIRFKPTPQLLFGMGDAGRAAPERADAAHPAGRGHRAALRLEGARAGHADPLGADGLPLRHPVRAARRPTPTSG